MPEEISAFFFKVAVYAVSEQNVDNFFRKKA